MYICVEFWEGDTYMSEIENDKFPRHRSLTIMFDIFPQNILQWKDQQGNDTLLADFALEEDPHCTHIARLGLARDFDNIVIMMLFMQKQGGGHLLAVADEEGFVSIYNTRLALPTFMTTQFNTGTE